jgi:hypothetical protein
MVQANGTDNVSGNEWSCKKKLKYKNWKTRILIICDSLQSWTKSCRKSISDIK